MHKHNYSRFSSGQVIAVIAVLGFLIAWVFQTISTAYAKGVSTGKSIRIAKINTCTISDSSTNDPHFSGCNSIL